jgi:epoxyqueuosine reductase
METAESHIKSMARELGFLDCGISVAGHLDKESDKLEKWLSKGYHGTMQYLENHFDKRLDPTKLVPGAKSVISLLYNYFPERSQNDSAPKIAKYAYGEDYHFVIKRKLKDFLKRIQEQFGEVQGRVFVDSAPVMERQWAAKSGLGWLGKHGLLLNKKQGSFFFIAEIIVDLKLKQDVEVTNHCGTCTACIDACPTDAIISDQVLDASKCISYLTIELKNEIPTSFKGQMENWAFGCDICQDVCPWNKFSKPHSEPAFEPKENLMNLDSEGWHEMTREVFGDLFRKSAVKRTKFEGLKRNLSFIKMN